ncbi:hypothetical protein [Synechococcus sp. PCC 7336]|uniref:hypothetical protein n=1 Tax=Synechococcus sp. PCC 7336 TaxID=195250 RepID=UPI00034C8239|nr:hypothetical protein [Synechococcus sp. PCC 7336]
MPNKFQPQVAKLWSLLSSSDTWTTYREALVTTAEILKETAILFWYLVLLLLVAVDWLWTQGYAAVQNVRLWLTSVKTSSDSEAEPLDANTLAAQAGKAIASVSKTGLASAVVQARNQLGLPGKVEPEFSPPPTQTAEPEPVPVAASAPQPAPVAAPAPPEPVSEPQKPFMEMAPDQPEPMAEAPDTNAITED